MRILRGVRVPKQQFIIQLITERFLTYMCLCSMVHHLTSDIESVMGPNCTLVLETARLVYQVAKSVPTDYNCTCIDRYMYVYMCVYHRSEMVSQTGMEKFVCVLNSVV